MREARGWGWGGEEVLSGLGVGDGLIMGIDGWFFG